MPRRLLGVLILLLVSVAIGRAQGDAVLFTVGADTVRQHEFEYHWKRSTEDSRDAFLQKYGRFKQKVQYAKDLGLDTLPEHRLRKEQFQQLQLAKIVMQLSQHTQFAQNADSTKAN